MASSALKVLGDRCLGVCREALAFWDNYSIYQRKAVGIESEDLIEVSSELIGDGIEPGFEQMTVICAAKNQRNTPL